MHLQIIFNLHKQDLVLNNLQSLICHKTQQHKDDILHNYCVPYYNTMKTVKHSLLIMIFFKTNFTQSYSVV